MCGEYLEAASLREERERVVKGRPCKVDIELVQVMVCTLDLAYGCSPSLAQLLYNCIASVILSMYVLTM